MHMTLLMFLRICRILWLFSSIFRKSSILFFVFFSTASAANKPEKLNLLNVDLQLILAVDVSQSIDPGEGAFQRKGYINALLDPDIAKIIETGRYGRIALSYTEWAGPLEQWLVVDWQVINSYASIIEFVEKLKNQPPKHGQRTSISYGILHAITLMRRGGFKATRKVIDISGDGANNAGFYVHEIRNRAVNEGITINGLPIMNGKPSLLGIPATRNIDNYYEDCVVAGPGAFIVVAENLDSFAAAVRRKLILEIAGVSRQYDSSNLLGTNKGKGIFRSNVSYQLSDCMIGEKQFEIFRKKKFFDKN